MALARYQRGDIRLGPSQVQIPQHRGCQSIGTEPSVAAFECTGTSVTLWTEDLRYNPLEAQGLGFRRSRLLHLEICQQSRLWECGNPVGISKECGKGGKPVSWLSMLSILCHFHGLLWKRASQNQNPANAFMNAGRTGPNRIDERIGDVALI